MEETTQETSDKLMQELDSTLTQLQKRISATKHKLSMLQNDIEYVSMVLKETGARTERSASLQTEADSLNN